MTKKILVVGNGGREHAICAALKRSKNHEVEIYAFMSWKNPGIDDLASKIYLADSLLDFKSLKYFASEVKPDFAIIGPDDPIAAGARDQLELVNVPSFAPSKKLAKLESSKSFTRDLLKKYEIPGNPIYQNFTSTQGMYTFAESIAPIVVKFDGLAGGKGVKVQGDHFATIDEGIQFAQKCLESSEKVVIEEKLIGEEFSAMFFADGRTVRGMPLSQDHKRAFNGDKGPNTGGMGVISDINHSLPFLTSQDYREAKEITTETMNALYQEYSEYYQGIMYGGFITTRYGVRLIEYNARFGDPEGMNILSLLKSDFVDICEAVLAGTLDQVEIRFEPQATVCKYVVPKGYPNEPVQDEQITVDYQSLPANVDLYYASVERGDADNQLVLKGSRALAFVAKAESIAEAGELANEACKIVTGPVFFRDDIGSAELLQARIDNMQKIRQD